MLVGFLTSVCVRHFTPFTWNMDYWKVLLDLWAADSQSLFSWTFSSKSESNLENICSVCPGSHASLCVTASSADFPVRREDRKYQQSQRKHTFPIILLSAGGRVLGNGFCEAGSGDSVEKSTLMQKPPCWCIINIRGRCVLFKAFNGSCRRPSTSADRRR